MSLGQKKQFLLRTAFLVAITAEAAVWCLLNNASFKETVLAAVNLGDDTDTVGAVTGGLAGILYGYRSIPSSWIKSIACQKDIHKIGDTFYNLL